MIYGALLTLVMCYLSTYGMFICVKAADRLEQVFPQRFATYQSSRSSPGLMVFLARKQLGKRWIALAKSISVIGCVAINSAAVISGVVEVSGILHDYVGVSQLNLKYIILGTVLLITVICPSPEKLKPVGYISGGAIIIIGTYGLPVMIMIGDNFRLIITPEEPHPHATVDLFKFAGTGILCGVGGFAYEGVGIIFTSGLS